MSDAAQDRVRRVVTGVLHEVLREFHARAFIVLQPLSPEGSLLLQWCERGGLNAEAADPAVQAAAGDAVDPEELERAGARTRAARSGALTVHPVNRTVLLLTPPPPEPVLPLGDVPASAIAAWTGEWSAPAAVRTVAQASGGVQRLDAALEAWLERRDEEEAAFDGIDEAAAATVRSWFRRGRAARRRAGLVPKLGWRTVGHDLRY